VTNMSAVSIVKKPYFFSDFLEKNLSTYKIVSFVGENKDKGFSWKKNDSSVFKPLPLLSGFVNKLQNVCNVFFSNGVDFYIHQSGPKIHLSLYCFGRNPDPYILKLIEMFKSYQIVRNLSGDDIDYILSIESN
jgi:hypothetical protein